MIDRMVEMIFKYRILFLSLFFLMVGAGVYSYVETPMDVYPDLNAPIVSVITENHGMAPEDLETLVTFPLETSLNSLPYVKRIRSNTSLGISIIKVEFEYGTDIYFARQLVTEKLQVVIPSLPEGTEPPFIGPISSMFSDAVEFTIKGENYMEIRDYAEWILAPRLRNLGGVSNVINFGGELKQYQVSLNPNLMAFYGVTVKELLRAIRESDVNFAGGFIEEGAEERVIRGKGRLRGVEDIENILVARKEGVPVTLDKVAQVGLGRQIPRGDAGENGKPVLSVTVQNQYQADVMTTISRVNAVMEEEAGRLKGKYEFDVYYSQLDMIVKSLSQINKSILMGAVLVALVLMFFMNQIKSLLIVALSIPFSIFIAFSLSRGMGMTLNIMTLGGLAIAVGIIADSGVIMAENIFRRGEGGKDVSMETIRDAVKEVWKSIFFATLIIVAVFAPIFGLSGLEGRMFIPLSVSVSAALLGSLLCALVFIPLAYYYLGKLGRRNKKAPVFIDKIRSVYPKILRGFIKRGKWVFAGCLVLIAVSIFIFLYSGAEFMPEMDESALILNVLAPPEISLEESSRISGVMAEEVSRIPEVVKVIRRTGRAEKAEHAEPVNVTECNVVLKDKEDREKSIEEIKEEIRGKLKKYPGVLTSLASPLQHRVNHSVTGTKADIAVKIFGENRTIREQIADELTLLMKNIPNVTDVKKEQVLGAPQYIFEIDREEASLAGVTPGDVALVMETALNGRVVTEVVHSHKKYDVFVRYDSLFRDDRKAIERLFVINHEGKKIPLAQISRVVDYQPSSIIKRENGLRRQIVELNVKGNDLSSVVKRLRRDLRKLEIPEGYFVEFGGTYENQERALKRLALIFAVTLVIVFILLYLSLNSVKYALLILFNIPLALSGGALAMFLSGLSLSVSSFIGFIGLMGISVQDGIVLISHIKSEIDQGAPLLEALTESGKIKIRPVLMTTFTTLFGLAPLMVRNVTGSELQKPMAVILASGLFFSTIVTLLVIPALIYQLEKNKIK